MIFHLAVTICPVPAQRVWTVKIWVPWSQTPSTFVHRSKVWLGTLTAAKARKFHIPPKKTKLKIRKTKCLKNIFINRNTKQLKSEGTIRIFSKKATLPLLPSSSKVQSIPPLLEKINCQIIKNIPTLFIQNKRARFDRINPIKPFWANRSKFWLLIDNFILRLCTTSRKHYTTQQKYSNHNFFHLFPHKLKAIWFQSASSHLLAHSPKSDNWFDFFLGIHIIKSVLFDTWRHRPRVWYFPS